MEQKENISRRDALKRMAKTAMVVVVASMSPGVNTLANNTRLSSSNSNYVDRCYNDYSNYRNYSNHNDYSNYSNYRDYNNYNDYSNYNDYNNYSDYSNAGRVVY
ncbi:MAG: hypothetical protein IKO62_03445 [Bacteroidales bacterium]|nr:hypothetical protein [Bacteroidales bacterium]